MIIVYTGINKRKLVQSSMCFILGVYYFLCYYVLVCLQSGSIFRCFYLNCQVQHNKFKRSHAASCCFTIYVQPEILLGLKGWLYHSIIYLFEDIKLHKIENLSAKRLMLMIQWKPEICELTCTGYGWFISCKMLKGYGWLSNRSIFQLNNLL